MQEVCPGVVAIAVWTVVSIWMMIPLFTASYYTALLIININSMNRKIQIELRYQPFRPLKMGF